MRLTDVGLPQFVCSQAGVSLVSAPPRPRTIPCRKYSRSGFEQLAVWVQAIPAPIHPCIRMQTARSSTKPITRHCFAALFIAQRKAEPAGADGVDREAAQRATPRIGSSALLAVIILMPLFM